MRLFKIAAAVIFTMLAINHSYSQTYAPVVTMVIAAADGQMQEVSVRDSAVGILKLKDGSEYQFRPTVIDEPFTKAMIAIFKSDSTPLGEVQVTKGAAAVTSKTTPAFKIAIKSIELKK